MRATGVSEPDDTMDAVEPMSTAARTTSPDVTVEGRRIPFVLGVAVASVLLGIEPEIGAAVVRPFDFLVVAGLAMLVGRIALSGRIPRVRLGPPFWFLAAFLGWKGLNAAIQSTAATAAVEALQAVELVILYWLIAVATRTRIGLHRFVSGMAWMTLGIVVWSAAYHIAAGEFFRFKELGETKHAFGFLFVVLLVARMERIPRMGWRTHPATIAVAGVLTLLAGERKMWVAVAVVVAGVAIGSRRGTDRSVIAGMALVVVGTLLAIGPMTLEALPDDNYTARQLRSLGEVTQSLTADEEDELLSSSNRNRGLLTRLAVEQFLDHPVAGMGPDRFAPYVRSLGEEGPTGGRTPHNEYLLVAAENGLIGLTLFGGFVVGVAGYAIRARRRLRLGESGAASVYAFALLAITVNLFLAGGVINVVLLMIPAAIAASHRTRVASTAPPLEVVSRA